jgi:membrane protein
MIEQRTHEQDEAAAGRAVRSGPEGPTELPKRSWWAVLKRTVQGFGKDNLSDWAAALTYYSVLSIFPAVIMLTSVLGLLGPSATQTLIDNINTMVPGQGRNILITAIKELQHSESLACPLAIIGLAGALWSASAYIGAFMRASNAIYEMPEGRPIWKTIPLRLGLTLGVVVLLALCAVGVVVSGTVADRAGHILGIGSTGVLVWNIAKWPVLAVLASLAFALLYWASPLDELAPGAWHCTELYANNRIEADHGQLKRRLRPMRGLKTDQSARIIIAGHVFIQNIRRGHYELGVDEPMTLRVAAAFDELTLAI